MQKDVEKEAVMQPIMQWTRNLPASLEIKCQSHLLTQQDVFFALCTQGYFSSGKIQSIQLRNWNPIPHFLLQLPRKILSSRILFMSWDKKFHWVHVNEAQNKVNNNIIKLSILITNSIGNLPPRKELISSTIE